MPICLPAGPESARTTVCRLVCQSVCPQARSLPVPPSAASFANLFARRPGVCPYHCQYIYIYLPAYTSIGTLQSLAPCDPHHTLGPRNLWPCNLWPHGLPQEFPRESRNPMVYQGNPGTPWSTKGIPGFPMVYQGTPGAQEPRNQGAQVYFRTCRFS